jgi:long-chain acyl-CoA synthetase
LAKLKTAGKLNTLKAVITVDDATQEENDAVVKAGLEIFTYKNLLEIGQKSSMVLHPIVTPDSLAMICYTSGTTSKPKGVMLTHMNYTAMAEGISNLTFFRPLPDEIILCWLPLAHVFEQFVATISMATGVRLGFYSGDVAKLVDDLQFLRPQYFGSVPRVFNRIHENMTKTVQALTGFKKYLYNKGVASKLNRLRTTGVYTHGFYDRFVFNKVRERFGGRIRLVFVGGAPFTADVQEMSRIWLSCAVAQGYGQTESTGPSWVQEHDDVIPGSIGRPMVNTEGKLIDIPEMNYLSTDMENGKSIPRGEIMVRGPSVALGYFKDPELTKETFEPDGWLHTGDVGRLLPPGNMTIIDRRKNIFKLQQVNINLSENRENI